MCEWVCTVCRNSSGIQDSLVGMWLQLGPSDLVHSAAWVRSVRPSDIYSFDPKFFPLYSALNVAVRELAKCHFTMLFSPEGLFTCDSGAGFYIRIWSMGICSRGLSYQETSEWSLQYWTKLTTSLETAKLFCGIPSDCKQILVTRINIRIRNGNFFFNVFDIYTAVLLPTIRHASEHLWFLFCV